jgi:hypothetical protein
LIKAHQEEMIEHEKELNVRKAEYSRLENEYYTSSITKRERELKELLESMADKIKELEERQWRRQIVMESNGWKI